jgi:hypothetical protein
LFVSTTKMTYKGILTGEREQARPSSKTRHNNPHATSFKTRQLPSGQVINVSAVHESSGDCVLVCFLCRLPGAKSGKTATNFQSLLSTFVFVVVVFAFLPSALKLFHLGSPVYNDLLSNPHMARHLAAHPARRGRRGIPHTPLCGWRRLPRAPSGRMAKGQHEAVRVCVCVCVYVSVSGAPLTRMPCCFPIVADELAGTAAIRSPGPTPQAPPAASVSAPQCVCVCVCVCVRDQGLSTSSISLTRRSAPSEQQPPLQPLSRCTHHTRDLCRRPRVWVSVCVSLADSNNVASCAS